MKDFLYRLFYRLTGLMIVLFLLGIIMLFTVKPIMFGVFIIVVGFVGFFLFLWLKLITKPNYEYEADENGNAKPNYR